jgi:hypothetical protein
VISLRPPLPASTAQAADQDADDPPAVRDNVIGENGRYGIYVDVDGEVDLAGNAIFGSRAGVMLKGSPIHPSGDNQVFDNREGDIVND